jgi:protein phosphatase 2C
LFQPNREDEYARIEAQGGKVIQWNGYRVLGVLAMSRSIGTYPSPLDVMSATLVYVSANMRNSELVYLIVFQQGYNM